MRWPSCRSPALYAVARLPHGRHAATPGAGAAGDGHIALSWPLLTLEVAIACYVAAEVGVSDWLVRFLDTVPLGTPRAPSRCSGPVLRSAGSSRRVISDRFDHLQFTTVAVTVAGSATFAAVATPVVGASIVLFGLVGFAFGPVFPMIVAIGGERFPERSAAVGGFLTGAAVFGVGAVPADHGLHVGQHRAGGCHAGVRGS